MAGGEQERAVQVEARERKRYEGKNISQCAMRTGFSQTYVRTSSLLGKRPRADLGEIGFRTRDP